MRKILFRRLREALFEVGVLMIAFAPLDVALSNRIDRQAILYSFLGLGVLLFVLSVVLEAGLLAWRRSHVE